MNLLHFTIAGALLGVFGWGSFCAVAAFALHRAYFGRSGMYRASSCVSGSGEPDLGERVEHEKFGFDSARRVGILSEDGINLSALWFTRENAAPPVGVAILLHDRRGSWEDLASLIPRYCERGWCVLATDLRAHGLSGGNWTTLGIREARDLELWLSWVQARLNGVRIIAHGRGIGAVAALNCALLDENPTESPRLSAVIGDEICINGASAYREEIGRLLPWRLLGDGVFFFSRILTALRCGVSLGKTDLSRHGDVRSRIRVPHALFETKRGDYAVDDKSGEWNKLLGRFE